MRKCISYLLVIVSLVGCIGRISLAASPSTESIREEMNQEIKRIYGMPNYYPEVSHGRTFTAYTKDQDISNKQSIATYIPAYGSPGGKRYKAVNEYLGYTVEGAEKAPNPAYGWDAGWSGKESMHGDR